MKIPDYSKPNYLNPYAPLQCHFWSLFGTFVQTAFNTFGTLKTNESNRQIAEDTNETSREMQEDAQNHAYTMQEREFAYNAAEAQKARDYNAAEAQKARDFNAAEAEKARLWNSEEEVIKRRAAAGLNTAVIGNGGTTSGGSSATASGPSASGPSASGSPGQVVAPPHLATPTLQAPHVEGLAEAIMDAIKLPAELKKLDADTQQSYEQARLLNEEVYGKQLDNIYQQIYNNNAPELFRQQIEQARQNVANTKIDSKYKDTQRRAIADKASREAFEAYFQVATAWRRADMEAEQAIFAVDMQIAEYDKAVAQYEEDWKRAAFKLSYDYGSSYRRGSKANNFISADVDLGISADLGLGGSSSSSTSNSSSGSNNAKGNFSTTLGTNLANLIGINSGISASVHSGFETSLGNEQTLETINRFQLESLLHKATQLGAASKVLKTAKSKFEAEQALRKIGDINDYFMQVSKLRELTNSLRIVDLETNPFMQSELEQ